MVKWLKQMMCFALIVTMLCPTSSTSVHADSLTKKTEVYTFVNHDKHIEYPANKTNATSSNSQSGYSASFMLDGKTDTKWEANWNNPPQSVELTLAATNKEYITGFEYVSRQDKNISGVMTTYAVYASENGKDYEKDPCIEGTLTKKLGTFFVEFKEPVQAKSIKIVTDATAIAELRLLYTPSTIEDYEGCMTLAMDMREEAASKQGMTEGLYSPDALRNFDEGMSIVEAAGKPTDTETAYQYNANLITLYQTLKRSQWDMTADLNKALRNAEGLLDSASVGTLPLSWSEAAIKEYRELINDVQVIASGTVAAKGDILDAMTTLEDGKFVFEQAQINPDITYTGSKLQPLDYLMDHMTDSHFQGKGVGEDVYFEVDYKSLVQFHSLTLQTWWATGQCVNKVKVSYKDEEGNWKFADDGKTYALTYTTNTSTSESQQITFDNVFKGSAIRIYIVGAASNTYVIDELQVGLAIDEADMRIALDRDAITLMEGESTQLVATVLPMQATNKQVIWSSSDESIVSISQDGTITVHSIPEGMNNVDVIISATTAFGNKTATCVVTAKVKVASEDDKQNTRTRLEIAQKLLNASSDGDYQEGAKTAFESKLATIQQSLDSDITLGGLIELDTTMNRATKEFEEASYIPIRETKKLIDRITGTNSSDRFLLEMIPADVETGMDVYEVDWDKETGKPILRGNNGVSLSTAFNYYLKYYAYVDFPYAGESELVLPETLPMVESAIRIVFPYEYRHYFNENCEYKYTASLYGEAQWQHRIDWMAMNGFNMFLVDIGKHAIWYNAKDELGLDEAAIAELRRSNDGTEQYYGEYAISQEAIEQEGSMAKKVVQSALQLGMEPEVRPFIGNVPFMFPKQRDDYYGSSSKAKIVVDQPGSLFDGLRLYSAARWMNLPQGVFISPEVDHNDADLAEEMQSKYVQISDIYYNSLMETLGFNELGRTPKYVYKDLVGEQGFVVNHEAFPKKVLFEMSEQLEKLNPDAKWLQTSWRYQTWLPEYYQEGQLMFVDLCAENRPKWDGNNEFGQTPWLWSMLFNFGGNSGIGGGFDRIASGPIDAMEEADMMRGVSISPEGGDTNPALYALMAEMTWRSTKPDMEQWISDYIKRRYGMDNYTAASEELEFAWKTLYETVYSDFTSGDGPAQTLVNAKPKLTGAIARVYGSNEKVYETQELLPAWEALLKAAEKMPNMTEQFQYDLVDVSRQVMADASGEIYQKIAPAFQRKDKEKTLTYADMMVDLCEDMDNMLATNRSFLLGTRLKDAKNRGVRDSDKQYFEKVERTFLTYWVLDNPAAGDSGGLTDYCNRHLSGLMRDYYGMRWDLFRKYLVSALDNQTSLNQSALDAEIQENVQNWTEDRSVYTDTASGDTLTISKELYQKYQSIIQTLTNGTDTSRDLPMDDMTAVAGNEQAITGAEGPASNVLDNNASTIWHTAWNGSLRADQYITINLGKEQDVAGLRYLPRTSGNNGIITKYAIDVSNDHGQTYHEVTTGDWDSDNAWKIAEFVPEKATNVRLRTIDALSDQPSKLFASAAEIRLLAPKKEVDKTALQTVYETAQLISKQDYTDDSIATLETAMMAAKNVLENEFATLAEVKLAQANLQTAMDNLVRIHHMQSKELLKAAINKAQSFIDCGVLEHVNQKVMKYFNAALEEAVNVYANKDATNEELLEAWKNLADRMHYLDFTADVTQLTELIKECKALDLHLYEDDSNMTEFKAALANAEAVLADENRLDARIIAACNRLADAKANLRLLVDEIDTTVIDYLISKSEAVLEQTIKYDTIADSWNIFMDAIANARTNRAELVSQEMIDAAAMQLAAAYENIRLIANEDTLREFQEIVAWINQIKPEEYTVETYAYFMDAKTKLEVMMDMVKDNTLTMKEYEEAKLLIADVMVCEERDKIVKEPSNTSLPNVSTDKEAPRSSNHVVTSNNTTAVPMTKDVSQSNMYLGGMLIAGCAAVITMLKRRK